MKNKLPVLRAGFEGSGSPRWLMRTMQKQGLDAARGFALDLCLLAESGKRHGTLAAIADGRADVADADWLALAAARADGLPLTAVHPYGRILGSLMLARGLHGEGLDALLGRRLGVLSTGDKNWAILACACRDLAGFDLRGGTRIEAFASRAELIAALDAGDIDAALLHWHLVPALLRRGHRLLAEVPALADALGAAATPTTFFVVHETLVREQPELIRHFISAVDAATTCLRDDAASWWALSDEFGCAIDADAANELAELRQRWRGRVGDAAGWHAGSRAALEALRRRLQSSLPANIGKAPLPAAAFHPAFLP